MWKCQFTVMSMCRNTNLSECHLFSWNIISPMGVATTTDTTDSVRTSFGRPQNLYGMSVQVLAEKSVFFYLQKKVLQTVKYLTNLAIILRKKSEFLKIWQKTSRDYSVAVYFSLTTHSSRCFESSGCSFYVNYWKKVLFFGGLVTDYVLKYYEDTWTDTTLLTRIKCFDKWDHEHEGNLMKDSHR